MAFTLDRVTLKESIPQFLSVYASRPIKDNAGGMGINHSFATWSILREVKPSLVVESGVWRGHSTWLIEQACPDATVVCLDMSFSRLYYKSSTAQYFEKDFSEIDWTVYDTGNAIGFFDDHQNAYARCKDLYWAGFRHAIFEDNFPCGEGDCYSLRHVFAGFGHPSPQMSKAYRPQGWLRRREEVRKADQIARLGARQQIIVKPNDVDRSMLRARLDTYIEFPPLLLDETTIWGTGYDGHYTSPDPLLDSSDRNLCDAVVAVDRRLAYGYIAYVSLR
jgi:hypothetical protein